jgi:hypothetical protein
MALMSTAIMTVALYMPQPPQAMKILYTILLNMALMSTAIIPIAPYMPQLPQAMKILYAILLNMVPIIYEKPRTKHGETDISIYMIFLAKNKDTLKNLQEGKKKHGDAENRKQEGEKKHSDAENRKQDKKKNDYEENKKP